MSTSDINWSDELDPADESAIEIEFFNSFVANPARTALPTDSWSALDDVPDVEDSDIEREIDRYFRQVEDSYTDADFNAQMGW